MSELLKRVTKEMLNHMNEDELLEYINSLEESIEEDTATEGKLDTIIDNVLAKYDNFNDPRHLRASNIEAVNSLLRTKQDIHETRINNKKAILDVVMKKRDNDSRNKTMLAMSDKETDRPLDFKTLLIHLDNMNIHPVLDKEMLIEAESLIDRTGEVLDFGSDNDSQEQLPEQVDE